MISETVTVVKVEDKYAWVSKNVQRSCNLCQQNSNCGTFALAQAMGRKKFELRALNSAGAKVGDKVEVAIAKNGLLGLSLLVYLLPLCTMFILAAVAAALQLAEYQVVSAAFLGLVIGAVTVRHALRLKADFFFTIPVIGRIITPAATNSISMHFTNK